MLKWNHSNAKKNWVRIYNEQLHTVSNFLAKALYHFLRCNLTQCAE